MARHMRSHTTERVRAQGKFAKSMEAKASRVVESVPRVVEDVPLEAKDTNPYRFESDERQDLTYDNSHYYSRLDTQS